MDMNKILAELLAERTQIEEAILVLERIASGQGRRRGRPPKWMVEIRSTGEEQDGRSAQKRRPFSAATRAKMAEAQRKRWAAKNRAEA